MIVESNNFRVQKSPAFIVFEGINGAGKSTLLKSISDYLQSQKYSVVETREPGGTELGVILRSVLQETPHLTPDPLSELFLFSADRAEHLKKKIVPALSSGSWVLSDRYYYSTIAFQGDGRGVDRALIENLSTLATSSVEPDLVVLVDIPPHEALNRLGLRDGREMGIKDRFEREGIAFHTRVREGFVKIAKTHKTPFLILDGMKSKEALFEELAKVFGK